MAQNNVQRDCTLLAGVRWVTDAVSTKDVGIAALTSYYINNNAVHASDGRMVVSTPFPFEGQVLVPAEQFLRVLTNRPEGSFSWEHEPDRLVLKRGKFRGRIKTLPVDQWVYPTDIDPAQFQPIPHGLIDAVRTMLPFVSENATKPWATCMGFIDGYLYVSNNIVVARTYCDGTQPPDGEQYLLPRWVAEFILSRADGLRSWCREPERITFLWADGSWMRSTLVVDQYPPVAKIFESYYDGVEQDVEVTKEWTQALLRVGKVTDDPVIRLRVDEMRGASGEVLFVEDGLGTPCPEGMEETVWDLRYLAPVLEVATHWQPRVWPKPAPWRGDYIEGVILGRRD